MFLPAVHEAKMFLASCAAGRNIFGLTHIIKMVCEALCDRFEINIIWIFKTA